MHTIFNALLDTLVTSSTLAGDIGGIQSRTFISGIKNIVSSVAIRAHCSNYQARFEEAPTMYGLPVALSVLFVATATCVDLAIQIHRRPGIGDR